MKREIVTLGDALYEQLHEADIAPTKKLLKLLIEIYDQKNLAIRLNELGLNTSREALNRWFKDPEKTPFVLDERERAYIRKNLLPPKPAHWDNPDFTFVDLFAGIGGIRKGFEEIGGKCVFTSEWDAKARRTYLANNYVDENELSYFLDDANENPSRNKELMDITCITQSKNTTIPDSKKAEHIRYHIPEHDVLLAGFPCQPFSLAGVSKKNSLGRAHGFECETQGTLFFDVEKIIEARKPKFFVLENVKNLKSHDKGKTFAVIIRTLDRLGYWIADISDSGKNINEAIESVRNRSPEPAIIDAVNYIPQHRERIVLVGVRKDIAHDALTLRNLPKPEIKPTLKDLLCEDVPSNYTLTPNLWAYLYSYAIKHQVKGNGFGFGLVDPENPNATTRTLSARYYKDGSEILINHMGLEPEYLRNAVPGCTEKIRERIDFITQELKSFRQQNPDSNEAELSAFEKEAEEKYNQLHGRWPSSEIFDPCYKTPRRLTPQECARLMGFEQPEKYREPDDRDFNIVCADTSAYKQFGNSVVVPVFRAVATLLKPHIKQAIMMESEDAA